MHVCMVTHRFTASHKDIIVVMFCIIIVALPAPENVTAKALTPTSVEVTWDQSDGATDYSISYTTTDSQAGNSNDPVIVGNTTSYTIMNLMVNTTYNITVRGCAMDNIRSDPSNEASVRTRKWCIRIHNIITYKWTQKQCRHMYHV